MGLEIVFKDSLKKALVHKLDINDLTFEQLFKIILELFPKYRSNSEFMITCNSKSFEWTENRKNESVKNTFYVQTLNKLIIYVLTKLPGGVI